MSYSVDLTMTDSRLPDSKQLRRSASHSLASSVTPIHTSVGTSVRSKSMYTPFQPPSLIEPEYTSPIIQAGDRRRSRKSNVVLESPLEHTPLPSRKRGFVFSSLGEDERPTKRQRVQAEIDDSQLIRVQSRLLDTPEQPPFNLYLRQRPVSVANGSEVSRSQADPDSDEQMVSSPLTSLASEDFIQETSPHHLAKPGTTRWSKRVFALHRETGSYYPGDLVDCSAITEQFNEDVVVSIKFDDTEEADLALQHVRPLDLRIGDLIKLNMTGIRSKQWTITSLQRDNKNGTLFTDIHGHTLITARRKDNGQVSTFTIDQIYLPAPLFKPFQRRQFSLIQKLTAKTEPETPSRRQKGRLRSTSPTLSMKGSQRDRSAGLFSGLAMSVTIADSKKTTLRDKLERSIRDHGGVLLGTGLETLFEPTPYSDDHDIAPLRPTTLARSLRGAFVVADNPSRKAKYLQALALGLPCLHYAFIGACVGAGRVLDPRTYLLSAGEGRIEDGLVSMSMVPVDLSLTTSLVRALAGRRRLLCDRTMIVVTGSDPTSRKIHLFLSWAMGCADLTECATIEDAHHLLVRPEDGKRWDYINVQELEDTHAVRELRVDLRGRVMTNEDVVQSLITGRLCLT
ncbi:BRCT domain protein [Taphrina deformans PYCC 5710]|uniref:BRCT domain protein n=1 Tax=Taphrina deformans (strain PYCC 5710 / ATCC 11124 / CBS 356.35 / IMI 108563 / JCM 9778 / NBRC 8474) TaxID=1097556 RepID=R4XBC3_TAPDE|nr:BRCT domain protein [Taphrina deformans PYCC 5710]|eukprot:CCG83149.1 BRCT domain protein [Taphrina deformans PYCC 5710]